MKWFGKRIQVKKINAEIQPSVLVEDTPDAYISMKDELLSMLLGHLQTLKTLEEDANHQYDSHPDLAQTEAFLTPLFKQYREQYGKEVRTFCTDSLMQKGYAKSFGKPGEYAFLEEPYVVSFTMKQEDHASLTFCYHNILNVQKRFVLKRINGNWFVDEIWLKHSDGTWDSTSI